MNTENYVKFSDSGHGWLRVPLQEIADLGLADKISCYSYVKGKYAYLEEDCDKTIFLAAFIQDQGFEPAIVRRYIDDLYSKDNPRNYQSYPQTERWTNTASEAVKIILAFRAKEKTP